MVISVEYESSIIRLKGWEDEMTKPQWVDEMTTTTSGYYQ